MRRDPLWLYVAVWELSGWLLGKLERLAGHVYWSVIEWWEERERRRR